ncbi:MAG: folylpolyglutamate synthase/dihydrofolate synthase family protein [Microscillaceae bacterium]
MHILENYPAVLEYLYAQLPMFQREGKAAFKPGLDNIRLLLAALGQPQNQYPSLHIAGTNGKGSTAHWLAAILQAAGYRVGLHTSPHLKSYTERFKINGQPIAESEIVAFVNAFQPLIAQVQPSFFEISVAMAFHFFAQRAVEVAVIEVGLGGRLDSTNVLEKPELSLITNIGFDHMDLLGDTLAKIAYEKAGIIKPGVPVIISEKHPETEPVFRLVAKAQQAPLFFSEEHFVIEPLSDEKVQIWHQAQPYLPPLEPGLAGAHQHRNLKGVLQAVEVLRGKGWTISPQALQQGLAEVVARAGLKGRWQVLAPFPLTVCDVGHNEDGLRAIQALLARQCYENLHLVLGFSKEKEIEKMLALFPPDARYYFCTFDSPRALPLADLEILAHKRSLGASFWPNVNQARQAAQISAKKNDCIFIGGSTFVVAELDDL